MFYRMGIFLGVVWFVICALIGSTADPIFFGLGLFGALLITGIGRALQWVFFN